MISSNELVARDSVGSCMDSADDLSVFELHNLVTITDSCRDMHSASFRRGKKSQLRGEGSAELLTSTNSRRRSRIALNVSLSARRSSIQYGTLGTMEASMQLFAASAWNRTTPRLHTLNTHKQ